MLEKCPGAFILTGNGVGAGDGAHAVHTPLYDFNAEVIPLGVGYWVALVGRELGR
jgi:metal-dependent amidase/aminoacylase/carboxypeptidase family protein